MDSTVDKNMEDVAKKSDAPKAKKLAVAKAKKMTKPAAHPKYSDMVVAAILAMKSRTGSNRQAILKHVMANNQVNVDQAANRVKLAIKNGLDKGILRSFKDSGKGAGAFKLTEEHKQIIKDQEKQAKKAAAKKAAGKAKKTAKKPTVKKAAKKPVAKKVAKKPMAKKVAAKKVAKKPAKTAKKPTKK